MIPEINLKLETIEVKGGTTIKLTVRNIFYQGIIGKKIRTLFTWLRYHRHKTLKELGVSNKTIGNYCRQKDYRKNRLGLIYEIDYEKTK